MLAPQHNDTHADFALLRTASTPHLYPNAQEAWDHGRMARWPQFKTAASMVYFREADLPFQYALANAFTIGDANYCSMTGGTNPNRCFFFTGTNHGRDAPGPDVFNGPAMDNAYNTLDKGANRGGYTWTSYPERLEDAGISWQIYQNEEREFYALNPLLGFRRYREAYAASVPTVSPARTPRQQALYEKGIRTRDLDLLKADVVAGRLPQVSWICPTSSGSEHPAVSSPAQGAAYIAQVLDALTANPAVWARTALIVNFDENDGLFDHVPPPAPPSYVAWDADPGKAVLAGASTVDARDEYLGEANGGVADVDPYRHRPWGLGPRVPLFVISPWSKGGWVNSQVFDQTSTIRFVETRFGVREPNISPWRRAVTGDLTLVLRLRRADDGDAVRALPDTARRDAQAAAAQTVRAGAARPPALPPQAEQTSAFAAAAVFAPGARGGRRRPRQRPRRCACTFATTARRRGVARLRPPASRSHPASLHGRRGQAASGTWHTDADGAYDLWVLGPNGLHRHFTGIAGDASARAEIAVAEDRAAVALRLTLRNVGAAPCRLVLIANAYRDAAATPYDVPAGGEQSIALPLAASQGWYDFSVALPSSPAWSRRIAGRLETGKASVSDPAMHGPAIATQWRAGQPARSAE